jgi:lipopolysaccharide biosynthesis protein
MSSKSATSTRARLLAFYLPQFHPIPENDAWWGRGFTEWTNVAKSKPQFPGHYQPHVPAHLGFYDLRVAETREAQAALARRFGIEGFCYWHYWFSGKRLIERPFNEVLASGKPDFPFCLAWANETWSRRWLGEDKEILMKQTYGPDDDVAHIRWLMKAFADPRYIRVRGRPLFLIYRPGDLPDLARTTRTFREECRRRNVAEPYLVAINSHSCIDAAQFGFDETMDFEPQLGAMPGPMDDGLKIYDYVVGRERMKARKNRDAGIPCIFVSWDNTPRRGENGIVFINSSPEAFETGLRDVIESVEHKPHGDRIVFVNAWNEWAEGNHLEPDLKYGLRWLEAVRRANTVVAGTNGSAQARAIETELLTV